MQLEEPMEGLYGPLYKPLRVEQKESSEVTEAKLSYSQQVLLKLNEMKERRRRLVKYTYQKEFKGEDFEKGY